MVVAVIRADHTAAKCRKPIDRENCHGNWLNKGELDGLLRQQARAPLAMFLDRCFAKTETQKSD